MHTGLLNSHTFVVGSGLCDHALGQQCAPGRAVSAAADHITSVIQQPENANFVPPLSTVESVCSAWCSCTALVVLCAQHFSEDERFLVKTMRKSEMSVLLNMLPGYAAHMEQYPNSLITRFFGLHKVTPLHGRSVSQCRGFCSPAAETFVLLACFTVLLAASLSDAASDWLLPFGMLAACTKGMFCLHKQHCM